MLANKIKAKMINSAFFFLNHAVSNLPSFLSNSPFVLHIRVTSKCNLSCPFCYLKEGLNQEEHNILTIEEWEKILTSIPRRTIIDITGAEPFMAKDFDKLLALIKKLGFKCSVTTNGTVYNDHIIQTLIESSVEYILVSLDGLEATHNKLRGSDKAFSRSIDFLKQLKKEAKRNKKKLTINIKTMLIDENTNDLIELLKFIDQEELGNIITINLPFQNEARGGRLFKLDIHDPLLASGNTFQFQDANKAITIFEQIRKLRKSLKLPIIFKPSLNDNEIPKYIKNPSLYTPKSCNLHKNNLTIYYDGSLTPCDISVQVANIRELNYDLKKTYHTKQFSEFTSLISSTKHPACDGCVFSKQQRKEQVHK